jgi:hypothetical protein
VGLVFSDSSGKREDSKKKRNRTKKIIAKNPTNHTIMVLFFCRQILLFPNIYKSAEGLLFSDSDLGQTSTPNKRKPPRGEFR